MHFGTYGTLRLARVPGTALKSKSYRPLSSQGVMARGRAGKWLKSYRPLSSQGVMAHGRAGKWLKKPGQDVTTS